MRNFSFELAGGFLSNEVPSSSTGLLYRTRLVEVVRLKHKSRGQQKDY
jgi:hypothetical protein